MLLPRKRLRSLNRVLRHPLVRVFLAVLVLFHCIRVWRIHATLASAALPSPRPVPRHSQRVYVASIHWNNAKILRSHWNDAVVALADRLGPANVFVSVHEGGSWDDSKSALAELDAALAVRGVARTVETSNVTHRDSISRKPTPDDDMGGLEGNEEEGWIMTARGRKELRRIPYLAGLRNQSLRRLRELHAEGVDFDRVLFLNDVAFTVDDVLALLDTNGGAYAAACAMDYKHPPQFYDTFALRDSGGHAYVMQTWPYFRSEASREAMLRGVPVPVASCWNGVVAMPAAPFVASPPLGFRGVADSLAAFHLEGSECCLIHADNPLSRELGVWVNPAVRVGYDGAAYEAVHPGDGSWVSLWQISRGLWLNRVLRWTTAAGFEPERWTVLRRLNKWRKQQQQKQSAAGTASSGTGVEPGGFCLINEMQVVVANGWAHV